VFRRGDFSNWRGARVLREACDLCGEEVGVRWMKLVGTDDPGLFGEACARHSPEIER
jgi:hypothetical protein